MTQWLIAAVVGCATGILSGFGVGGGSLLLIYLTAFAGVSQHQAQGINLLYFIPAALTALPAHFRQGYVAKPVLFPAILTGLLCAGLAAWVSNGLELPLLRKLFGLFLLYVGFSELFRRDGREKKHDHTTDEGHPFSGID